MTPIEQWLSQINPSELPVFVLVLIIVVGIGQFVNRKFWPWWEQTYWPGKMEMRKVEHAARIEAEREQTKVLGTVRDAMIRLEVVAGQQMLLLQQHGQDSQRDHKKLLDWQRAALDRIGAEAEPVVAETGKGPA